VSDVDDSDWPVIKGGLPRLGSKGVAKVRVIAPFVRRLMAAIMMAATVAFTVQATFIAHSEAAPGESGPYHHGFASQRHHEVDAHHHEVTHVHADGTAHRHAVDDDDGALDDHIQEPGCPCCWNMAIVTGLLPNPAVSAIPVPASSKLAIEAPGPCREAEPNGLRKPPRPPSIA